MNIWNNVPEVMVEGDNIITSKRHLNKFLDRKVESDPGLSVNKWVSPRYVTWLRLAHKAHFFTVIF